MHRFFFCFLLMLIHGLNYGQVKDLFISGGINYYHTRLLNDMGDSPLAYYFAEKPISINPVVSFSADFENKFNFTTALSYSQQFVTYRELPDCRINCIVPGSYATPDSLYKLESFETSSNNHLTSFLFQWGLHFGKKNKFIPGLGIGLNIYSPIQSSITMQNDYYYYDSSQAIHFITKYNEDLEKVNYGFVGGGLYFNNTIRIPVCQQWLLQVVLGYKKSIGIIKMRQFTFGISITYHFKKSTQQVNNNR